MARPSNTGERRQQIARALLKVMAKKGYDGASIAAIARAARVAQGLVHYHFKDKREILLLAIEELGARHRERLDARLGAAGGAEARLEAFLVAHLGLEEADGEALACWVLVSGEALQEKQVGRAFEEVLRGTGERLKGILEAGVKEGAWVCEDLDAAVAALLALIQGYFVLAASARGVIPPGSALATARRVARGLLGASEAPPGRARRRVEARS